jgi:hypothetical protein
MLSSSLHLELVEPFPPPSESPGLQPWATKTSKRETSFGYTAACKIPSGGPSEALRERMAVSARHRNDRYSRYLGCSGDEKRRTPMGGATPDHRPAGTPSPLPGKR